MELLIHYHWAPHFRSDIFDALVECSPQKVSFYIGKNVGVEGVGVLNHVDGAYTKLLKNWFLGPLIFQFWWPFSSRYLFAKRVVLGDAKFVPAYVSLLLSLLGFGETHLWTHGVLMRERGWKWRVRKLFYSMADSILSYSEYSAVLLREGGLKKPVISIGNSNFSLTKAKVISAHISGGERRHLVYIGRIIQGKNLESLISMLEFLPKNVTLKLIGSGNAVADLKALAIERVVQDRVEFVGESYGPEALALLTRDCIAGVVPGAVGLSGFTYLLLGLNMLYSTRNVIHKPEMHILKEYSYGFEVDDFRDGVAVGEAYGKLRPISVGLRETFLEENCASSVAKKLVAGVGIGY